MGKLSEVSVSAYTTATRRTALHADADFTQFTLSCVTTLTDVITISRCPSFIQAGSKKSAVVL